MRINSQNSHLFLFSHPKSPQVIPRHNIRGRNRSSSAKFTSNASLLPTAGVAVRSNSFRVHRSSQNQQQQHQPPQQRKVSNVSMTLSTSNTAGIVDSIDFCKHIKYCCLHQLQLQQQFPHQNQASISSKSDNDLKFTPSSFMNLNFNELPANFAPNYSDDEKSSMGIHRKFSADANTIIRNSNHFNNKSSSQQLMNYYVSNYENNQDNCGKFMLDMMTW